MWKYFSQERPENYCDRQTWQSYRQTDRVQTFNPLRFHLNMIKVDKYINLIKFACSLKCNEWKRVSRKPSGSISWASYLPHDATVKPSCYLPLPPVVLLTNNSYLRVAFVYSVDDQRCLHDGFTRASRSRIAFLTQLVKFACASCCPREWFGRHGRLPQHSRFLRLFIILWLSSGVTSRVIRDFIFVCPSRVKIGTVWRGNNILLQKKRTTMESAY